MKPEEYLTRTRHISIRRRQLQILLDQEEAAGRGGKSWQLAATLRQELRRLDDVKQDVLEVIALVPDATQRNILLGYYVQDKTWEKVAESVNYCYAHTVHRLHKKALENVSQILEQREREPLPLPGQSSGGNENTH